MTELGTFIVLSTAHLEQDVSEAMTAKGPDSREPRHDGTWLGDLTVCEFAYGHWVRVHRPAGDSPEEMAEYRAKMDALPQCLSDCMRHAGQFGARWILFDQDAEETVGTLRQYHW